MFGKHKPSICVKYSSNSHGSITNVVSTDCNGVTFGSVFSGILYLNEVISLLKNLRTNDRNKIAKPGDFE